MKKPATLLAPIDTFSGRRGSFASDYDNMSHDPHPQGPQYLQPETIVNIDIDATDDKLSLISKLESHANSHTAAHESIGVRILKFILKIVLIIVPRPQPGIWTLENSMFPITLRFKDEKIERAYQWHVNKRYFSLEIFHTSTLTYPLNHFTNVRYLRLNRRFSWFLTFFSLALIVYHWLVETPSRFVYLLPCFIVMTIPMLICVIITYIRRRERYFVYKNLHLSLSIALFVTSFGWIFGQPAVLLILGDPLILDPVHTLLIFFIFNLAITNLHYSVISTTALILIQCLTCVFGLYFNGSPFSKIFSYLVNDFFSLVLAYIFAFMCARVKEMYMRQIYLVRHFQKEEASILQSSRLKLEIMEEGMRAMKNQHPHVSPPASPVFRRGPFHAPILRQVYSEPSLPRYPPRALVSNGTSVLEQINTLTDVSRWDSRPLNSETDTPLLRLMRSCQFKDDEMQSTPFAKATSTYDDLEVSMDQDIVYPSHIQSLNREGRVLTRLRSHEDFASGGDGSAAEQSLFFSVLSELPLWIIALPLALKSRSSRKSLWKRFLQFVKYKVCMYSGEKKMELGFQLFFTPLSICRVRVLAVSAIIGGVTITALNYVVQNYVLFEVIIRLAYMPAVAFALYFGVSTKKFANSPKLCQSGILIGVYLIFVGYLMLVFDAHWALRDAYSMINPLTKIPSLNSPTSSDKEVISDFPWIPKSPFDVDVTNPSTIKITNSSSIDWNQIADFINTHPEYQQMYNITQILNAQEFLAFQAQLLNTYIQAEAKYMNQLNALTLFCCFAACSSGMRLVFFLMWKICVIITVTCAASYATYLDGPDGQLVRTVVVIISVVIAGVWIARPLESELRKWYHIKVNYSL